MIRSVQKEDDAIRTRVELTPQTPHELMAYDCEKQYECAWVGNAGELRGSRAAKKRGTRAAHLSAANVAKRLTEEESAPPRSHALNLTCPMSCYN